MSAWVPGSPVVKAVNRLGLLGFGVYGVWIAASWWLYGEYVYWPIWWWVDPIRPLESVPRSSGAPVRLRGEGWEAYDA